LKERLVMRVHFWNVAVDLICDILGERKWQWWLEKNEVSSLGTFRGQTFEVAS